MMKTKKERQSIQQRVMREFTIMAHDYRAARASCANLRATAKAVWKLHPAGYKNFGSFYKSVRVLASKYETNR